MYYTTGNYEAFAKPKKPANVDQKSAHLVGGGLASLSAAVFLIRDGQMDPKKIHIYEELKLPGGSLDGVLHPGHGFIMRGGREMENHFECLWDMFRSIPSIENENISVLDEFYWLNQEDPNFSYCRLIEKRGKRKEDDGKFTLDPQSIKEIVDLWMTPESHLDDVKINEVFSEEFFKSNFWWYWSTMFAFEKWHSAMEMRRYIMRFVHHIDGLPDFSALKFTKYNQYYSLIEPLVKFVKKKGVNFHYNTKVEDVVVEMNGHSKVAKKIIMLEDGAKKTVSLNKNDLVFITNGSITESTTYGTNNEAAPPTNARGGSWELWEKMASQSPEFGRPWKFYKNIPLESWFVSATTMTLDKKLIPYIEKISKRDPFTGKTVTGGIVTAVDSSWVLSYTINRQPQFINQPEGQIAVWIYGLLSNIPGDFIKKSITDCSGNEIAQEWMYHMGVPEDKIEEYSLNSTYTTPCYMPYICSYFMPRAKGDRPLVVPNGSENLAFIGNFSETEYDTVFTTEYSVRTAMEAVYRLLDIDHAVPQVYPSAYNIRTLLNAAYYLNDKRKIREYHMPFYDRMLAKFGFKKLKGTWIEELLREAHLI
ncbi:oleate hydratase [Entomoplasma freundtii]|uniref:Oleate hydratase n=1 Tax=Entomoplasma freundtii TaxID=74700 RepID=A0A2K8NRL2_9MOLU|nr:oleate hydratase [Entomoplasma freundtii]ATZ16439.1 oleate hydratase [Entomoplasma freundtii]TDY55969.1 oleate hydratase [Entomoplasma freundtii]